MKISKILSAIRTMIILAWFCFLFFVVELYRFPIINYIGIVVLCLWYVISTIFIFKEKVMLAQIMAILPAIYIVWEGMTMEYQIINTTYVGIGLIVFEIALFIMAKINGGGR